MSSLPTHAVTLTPAGRSAIAVVLVNGPQATVAVDACFHAANGKPLGEQPLRRVRFGHWGSVADQTGEELVVCRRQAQQVEIHCHGGHAAVRAVMADLAEQGCVALDWQSWVKQSAAGSIGAEAQLALASATTERTAGILLDQFNGALAAAIESVSESLAKLDSPAALEKMDALLSFRQLGRHLTQPWRVVLVGPPNVGKSSLINALVGYDRAIVFDQPGTTRDVVTADTAIDGWPITLADTAGLRDSANAIEAAGIDRAKTMLAAADLVLVVQEATTDQAGADSSVAAIRQATQADAQLLVIANKNDLATEKSPTWCDLATCATTGNGIEQLIQSIGQTLVPTAPKAGAAVPFTERQGAALTQARQAVTSGDQSTANDLLRSLLAVE